MKCNRTVILLAGVCSLLYSGLIYAWSIFVAPLENEFGWTRAETSTAYTVSLSCFCIGILLSGMLARRFKPRRISVIASILIVLGFTCVSRATMLLHLYIFYGVLCGLGVGVNYNVWLTTVVKWFPERSGFASGVLLMGFGCGGLVLGAAVSALLYSPVGWRNTFLILAGAVLVVTACTLPFLSQPNTESQTITDDTDVSLNTSKMLRQPAFWLFTLWKIVVVGIGQCLIGQAAPLVADVGGTVALATLVVGAISIANGIARVLFGLFFDRFGRYATMWILTIGNGALAIVLLFSYQNRLSVPLCVSLCLAGLLYGGSALISSAFINNVFGLKYFSSNMGVNSLTTIPATVFASTLISVIKTQTGNYTAFFPVMLVICVLAGLTLFPMPAAIRRIYTMHNDHQTTQKCLAKMDRT